MCSQLQVVLVALSVLVLVSRVSAAPRGDVLTQLLQNEADTKENEDISRMLMLKLLSELEVAGENEVLSGADVRNDVVRQLPFSQRERKTGCRNFFWKTFTSC
ncbi:somatostatin-1 [Astyanax mexicanus]|uniref:Somatostatin/Cortistatin C-terminal domain-containing protein n=2 Tax=Astyanax mexicanus TaxID=7994 RepID=A0A3B1JX02_ASTMX|nr:somatostatin-1 [Astyanax mexicanus]KAG9274424.1 somatostatin-1-like [Astyanax mexicanus]